MTPDRRAPRTAGRNNRNCGIIPKLLNRGGKSPEHENIRIIYYSVPGGGFPGSALRVLGVIKR